MSQSSQVTRASSSPASAGVLARFDSPNLLRQAAEAVRHAGHRRFDVFTPYPVHGMDQAMGLGRSPLGWLVLAGALGGVAAAVVLQGYASAVDYPLITGGKPYFSWQAFVPITFELMVLFAALAAVGGMLALNDLPRWHHPLLKLPAFAQASDAAFFLFIASNDPRFDAPAIIALLTKLGGLDVQEVQP